MSGNRPRRLNSQLMQEGASLDQFKLALNGSNFFIPLRDLGEDLLVQLYDDGRWTGLSFFAQLKSTTKWKRLVPKNKPGELHYPLFVKDLEHWLDTAPPVVVVIWDTDENCGFWQDVPSIVRDLDKCNPSWRKKKSASVSVPLKHTLESVGQEALRHRIGQLSIPAISAGRQLELKPTFRYPNTSEGRAALKALQVVIEEGIEEGDKFTISGENITQLQASPWWERVFGKDVIPESITIESAHEDETVMVFLTAIAGDRAETIPVELHRRKGGTKRVTLSNDSSDEPVILRLTVDVRSRTAQVGIKFNHPGKRVLAALKLTQFLRILGTGGSLQLGLYEGAYLGPLSPKIQPAPDLDSLAAWERLLKLLLEIQPKVTQYGQFILPRSFTSQDLHAALQVHAVCTRASWESRMTYKATLRAPPKLPEKQEESNGNSEQVTIENYPIRDVLLFGVRIPMGRVRIVFQDGAKATESLILAERKGSTKIAIKDAPVLLKFLDWEPPLTGPSAPIESPGLPGRSSPAKRVKEKLKAAKSRPQSRKMSKRRS